VARDRRGGLAKEYGHDKLSRLDCGAMFGRAAGRYNPPHDLPNILSQEEP